MVLGIITAIAACPAIVGTTEAVRQGQRSNAKEKHRGTKTNLIANCASVSRKSGQIDGGAVVLNNNKVQKFLSLSIPLFFISLGSEMLTGKCASSLALCRITTSEYSLRRTDTNTVTVLPPLCRLLSSLSRARMGSQRRRAGLYNHG